MYTAPASWPHVPQADAYEACVILPWYENRMRRTDPALAPGIGRTDRLDRADK